MKLKLESNDKIKTLAVTESISATDVLVLKAGIQKLFLDKGTSRIILDFCQASTLPPETKEVLIGLKEQAPVYECTFLIAGPQSGLLGIAHGNTPDEAEASYKSRPTIEILRERAILLQSRFDKQKKAKEEAEKKLAAQAQDKNDPRRIMKTTSDLKRTVARLEAELAQKLAGRKTEPFSSEQGSQKFEFIRETIFGVLEAEGILKAKGK